LEGHFPCFFPCPAPPPPFQPFSPRFFGRLFFPHFPPPIRGRAHSLGRRTFQFTVRAAGDGGRFSGQSLLLFGTNMLQLNLFSVVQQLRPPHVSSWEIPSLCLFFLSTSFLSHGRRSTPTTVFSTPTFGGVTPPPLFVVVGCYLFLLLYWSPPFFQTIFKIGPLSFFSLVRRLLDKT